MHFFSNLIPSRHKSLKNSSVSHLKGSILGKAGLCIGRSQDLHTAATQVSKNINLDINLTKGRRNKAHRGAASLSLLMPPNGGRGGGGGKESQESFPPRICLLPTCGLNSKPPYATATPTPTSTHLSRLERELHRHLQALFPGVVSAGGRFA